MVKQPTSKERVEHVLKAISSIHSFMQQEDLEKFQADIKLQSAVQYQFLIIGEAIKHVDSEVLDRYKYPWHIPRSFRNFIIHAYHGIKLERIYNATQELEELKNVLQDILKKEYSIE
ncbi:MAG: DUF86 domain-containing protein [Bacteroidota bacterium]|nr:DUF86 domain-containing protein [Bacteroidota bacterium]